MLEKSPDVTLLVFVIVITSLITTLKANRDCDGSIPIITKVKQGEMRGKSMTSVKGKQFCAFQGIPYAEPPVGRLRFMPPQPLTKWEETLSATKEGEDCVHPSFLIPIARGSEDCLYLNVYTPSLNTFDGNLLDVMVFITPGFFFYLSSSTILFGPQFLMDKNVVLVTFNYRLGAFGFLSTEDDESPGNYGMKDQVAALRWVKDNIKSFGGNPNSITIFGSDAGGASVHYHMLSSASNGLFHRAISMDGTAIMPWARSHRPAELARKQAKLVGCPTSPSHKLVECLREVPLEDINRSIYSLFALWFLPGPGYAPVVERRTSRNPEPFLTEDPIQLLRSGEFQRVPWLVGGNSQAAAVLFAPVLNFKVLRKLLNKFSDFLWPKLLMLSTSVEENDIPGMLYNISAFYNIDTRFLYLEQDTNVVKMATDRYFIHGTHKAVELHSQAGHTSIYKYNFAYKGTYSLTLFFSLYNYGVSLGDDLRFLFETNLNLKALQRQFTLHLPRNSYDREVQELMLTLWTNFAKYGNPTTSENVNAVDSSGLLKNFVWQPVEDGHMRYFNIGQESTSRVESLFLNQLIGPVKINMADDLNKDRMDFWDSLLLNENVHFNQSEHSYSLPVTSGTTYQMSSIALWILLVIWLM